MSDLGEAPNIYSTLELLLGLDRDMLWKDQEVISRYLRRYGQYHLGRLVAEDIVGLVCNIRVIYHSTEIFGYTIEIVFRTSKR